MLVGYIRISSADERQSLDLQRDALIGVGCDLFQGYLFAKPAAGFPVPDMT